MKGVSVSAGGRALIGPLTLSLREGEVMGVLGANEVGKSTLARAMCGLAGGRQPFSWGARPRQRLRRSYYICLLYTSSSRSSSGRSPTLQPAALKGRRSTRWAPLSSR